MAKDDKETPAPQEKFQEALRRAGEAIRNQHWAAAKDALDDAADAVAPAPAKK